MYETIPNGLCRPEEVRPPRGEISATGISGRIFHGPVPKRPRASARLQRVDNGADKGTAGQRPAATTEAELILRQPVRLRSAALRVTEGRKAPPPGGRRLPRRWNDSFDGLRMTKGARHRRPEVGGYHCRGLGKVRDERISWGQHGWGTPRREPRDRYREARFSRSSRTASRLHPWIARSSRPRCG